MPKKVRPPGDYRHLKVSTLKVKQEELEETSLCDKARPGQNSYSVKCWQKCIEVGGYYAEK